MRDVATALREAGLDPDAVAALADAALAEDLAGGEDVTSVATVPDDASATAHVVPRSAGVVAGLDVAAMVFLRAASKPLSVECHVVDGETVEPGRPLLTVSGSARDLLVAERSALNLLGHLCGVATVTRAWVDAVAGTGARVRDTRKTTPLLRSLEKYAVRCGGGVNHRMSLSDAALVKDNHAHAAGGLVEAYRRVAAKRPGIEVQVEADTVADAVAVVDAGARSVLLDNFSTDELEEAVRMLGSRATLEASGGLTLDSAAAVAATGVHYLAVGALTHSAPVLDIGLDFAEA
jgi:nicotinate-nucleotide pyrophosphorylase (carboxylating)